MKHTAASKDAVYTPGADYKAAPPGRKTGKRENTFSKSRDTREDRGTREMKTTHRSQTLPHVP